MSKARDIANSTETLDVDGGTIKLDGNYPVGTGNVALGDAALDSNVSGASNTAIGSDALTANTASNNTAVGYQAGYANTTGTSNVALGYTALDANTTADNNTALGAYALTSNTTGTNNTASGSGVMNSNTTGSENTAMGVSALYYNNGSYNTAIGRQALLNNTTASYNTAVGYQAGYSNTTGSYNTFIGRSAGTNTTGGENTFVGSSAGNLVTTGQKNTILGKFDGNAGGLDIRTSSNYIVLSDGDGNPTQVTNGTSSDIVFGGTNPDDDSPTIGVQIDHGDGTGSYINIGHTSSATSGYGFLRFFYNGGTIGQIQQSGTTGVTYSTSSDHRLKENVIELTGATDRLKQLKPSRFNFIADPDRTVDGFLAHEVQSIVPEAITGTHNEVDADGNPVYQGIDQSKLVPLLVATIKELEARITALEAD